MNEDDPADSLEEHMEEHHPEYRYDLRGIHWDLGADPIARPFTGNDQLLREQGHREPHFPHTIAPARLGPGKGACLQHRHEGDKARVGPP